MSFQLGENTLKVTPKLFAENRTHLINELRQKVSHGGVVVLEGGKERFRYNTDFDDLPFRQESYFFWAFGVHESDCYGIIDIDSGKSILLPPRLHPDFAIWSGKIEPESWFLEKYETDEVHFNDKDTIRDILHRLNAQQILLLRAENTDSGSILEPAEFEGKDEFNIDITTLYPILAELRVIKTDLELEVLRYAVQIACDAHRTVMRNIQPGYYEYQME
uniref:Aminopeptidase P N-terminal domain-containing protein n=1 Tax=Acrobeloides nanus TaxID=290746 RepID=A0A914CH41_9BILA